MSSKLGSFLSHEIDVVELLPFNHFKDYDQVGILLVISINRVLNLVKSECSLGLSIYWTGSSVLESDHLFAL